MTIGEAFQRAAAAWRRAAAAHRRRDRTRTTLGRATTALVCVTVGLLVTVSAANARGIDLRPARNTDLVSVVQAQSKRNAELTRAADRDPGRGGRPQRRQREQRRPRRRGRSAPHPHAG